MSLSEKLVWFRLRGRRFFRFKFCHQFGIGPYILDFYCPTTKLAIEIDRASIYGTLAYGYDHARNEFLNAYGITVLRFTNQQIFHEQDDVIQEIQRQLRILFQQRVFFFRGEAHAGRAQLA